jgi:hypothetical protein
MACKGASDWNRGCHIIINRDHRPSESLFNIQKINEIKNIGIRNIRLTLLGFNFTVEYISSKSDVVVDCLNKKPMWNKVEEEVDTSDTFTFAKVCIKDYLNAPLLQDIFTEAA